MLITDAMPRDATLPHRRRNPLTGRHVLVSPQRALRPWLGEVSRPEPAGSPSHDPNCALCPGNPRANGQTTPSYSSVYAFDNDFPAVLDGPAADAPTAALFAQQAVSGAARVICYSPNHALSFAELDESGRLDVINLWCTQTAELGARFRHVQVFENKGAMMGCSTPHPHGQIWATSYVPDEVALEDQHQRDWHAQTGGALLTAVAQQEIAAATRVVEVNADWVVIVPFWASWPFETLVLPLFTVARLPDLTMVQRASLADILGKLTARYDNLFGCSFPYSMGWHGAPFDARDAAPWQLHAHFLPPLLRSATVRKFMVGFELLAEAQRDLTPEQAAERLRAVSNVRR
jgi:UDPglucose--hexose-1-phosphate uridylyltransferase